MAQLLGHLGPDSSLVAIGNIHGQGEHLLEHLAELPADDEPDDEPDHGPGAGPEAVAAPAGQYDQGLNTIQLYVPHLDSYEPYPDSYEARYHKTQSPGEHR